MAYTITTSPSGLSILQRSSTTSGVPSIHLEGALNAPVSAIEYSVSLSSGGTVIVSDTSLNNIVTTSTEWAGDTGTIPIGPSGGDFPDWYELKVIFHETNAANTTITSNNPWGVGQAWVILGQSNAEYMGPNGPVAGVGVSDPVDSASGISILDTEGSVLNWEQVDGSGVKAFLSSMAETYQTPIAVIQTAVGSAPIFKEYNKFVKGKTGYWLNRASPLWKDLLSGIDEVGGNIEGVITHQGEMEAFWTSVGYSMPEYKMKVEIYKAGFENLIKRVRDYVGNQRLPILLGQLPGLITDAGTWATIGNQYDNIVRAQVRIAEDDPFTKLTMTYDLERVVGDALHMSSTGQYEFGKRLASNANFFLNKDSNYTGATYLGASYVSSGEYELKFKHARGATDWSTTTKSINLSGFHVVSQDGDSYEDIEVTTKTSTSLKLKVISSNTEPLKIGYNTFGLVQFPTFPPSANLDAYPKDNSTDEMPIYPWDGFVPLPKPFSVVPPKLQGLNGNQVKDLVDIIVFAHDEGSTLLDDALDLYITSNTVQTNIESAGPFYRFLKALSWSIYDINALIEQISELIDIEQCPKEFFAYLAKMVGWKLISNDIDSWRAQLRQAIYLYKSKGTRSAFEDALKLIFPDQSFNPTGRLTELWESYLPKVLYYIIKTESPLIDTWSKEDSRDFDIPFSEKHPDWNARFLVDFILARIEEELPGFISNPLNFKFGEDFFEYRGSTENVVPNWEEERYYDTFVTIPQIFPIINFHLSGVKSRKGLEVPVSAINYMTEFMEDARYGDILQGTNNRWKFFTSSVSYPGNYDNLLLNYDSDKLHLLDYWSGKASTVSLSLSTGDFDFTIEELTSQSKYAIDALANILKDFKPFHVILELLLYDDLIDTYTAQDSLLNWSIIFCIQDIDNLGADAGFENIAFGMVSGAGTVPRGTDNRMPDTTTPHDGLYTVSADIPRFSIRRRDREFTLNYCSFYKMDGFAMPVGWDFLSVSSTVNNQTYPISATGFLPRGFNPSSGEYFPTSSVIYSPDLLVTDTVSGIPVSSFYPVRDLSGLPDVDITHYETRSNLNSIMEIFYNSLQRRATAEYRESFLSSNPDWEGPIAIGTPFNDGIDIETKFKDFELSGELNKIYSEDYVRIFKKNLYNEFSDYFVLGGGSFNSHIVGPLVYNGNLYKNGNQFDTRIGTETGHYLATSSGNYQTVYNRSGVASTIVSGQFNTGNTAFGITDKTYKLQLSGGFGASVESTEYVSGVTVGFGIGSQSLIAINGESGGIGSNNAIDSYNLNNDSITLINRESSFENGAYIQFTLGTSALTEQSWELYPNIKNGLLPEYDYDIDFVARDSDLKGESTIGVCLFSDDFHGIPYYFDWQTETWKDIEHLVSIKRKNQTSLYDIKKAYLQIPFNAGNEVKLASKEQYYDPKTKKLVQSDINRLFRLRFNTKNNSIDETSKHQLHAFNHGGLHSGERTYYLRFVQISNNGSFVTFKDFSLKNATYNKIAEDLYLSGNEIPTVFDYFDSIAVSGIQSKDKVFSSSTHGNLGGSKLVYLEPGGYPSLSSLPTAYAVGEYPFTGGTTVSAGIYEISDG